MKKLLTSFTAICAAIFIAVCVSQSGRCAETEQTHKIADPVYDAQKDYAVWDCIYFGNYPQDSISQDNVQPVKWRVLSVDGNDAMLISDKMLFASEYISDMMSAASWKGSRLRSELALFGQKAFTEEEYNSIITVKVNNKCNPDYPVYGDSEDTEERIYVLSYDEACNPGYGFCADEKEQSKTRQAAITKYAISTGNVTRSWWLRTPGAGNVNTANVDCNGQINSKGTLIMNDVAGKEKDYLAVRPVLHLDISNTGVWSYAGKVTSDDELPDVGKDTKAPTPAAEPTKCPQTDAPAATSMPAGSPQSDAPATPTGNRPSDTADRKNNAAKKHVKTFVSGKLIYRIVSGNKKAVYVCGIKKSEKSTKHITIPGKVHYKKRAYKVTGIDNGAFKNMARLKVVKIKTNYLDYIGKEAFGKMKKKLRITVPKEKSKSYNRLIRKA